MADLDPGTYVVYGGQGEPLGLLAYGGRYYYSDGPPWVTPADLAWNTYRKKSRAKFKLVPEGAVSDEVWEHAQENERSGKYRRF